MDAEQIRTRASGAWSSRRQTKLQANVREALGRAGRADPGDGYEAPGRSSDRSEACVWALAELIGSGGQPRVVGL